jgi:hypothetical protein
VLAVVRLRHERPAGKIFIGFGSGYFFDAAVNAHFAFKVSPVKDQRCARIAGQFATFAAHVIGIKNKAVVVNALEQDDAS